MDDRKSRRAISDRQYFFNCMDESNKKKAPRGAFFY
jgi:hypothetical protein